MDANTFSQIRTRYRSGQATEEEKAFIEAWYAAYDARPDIIAELSPAEQEQLGQHMYTELTALRKPAAPQIRRSKRIAPGKWMAAAALLAIITATWLFTHNGNKSAITTSAIRDIAPGHAGAILTLSDGRQLVLDSAGNGQVATENGSIVTLQDNQLSYQKSVSSDQPISYNLLSTPAGRQFQLSLPDGTKVWLNAASSIRFPTAFTGSERNVEITGEAYLEVAQNAKQPFGINTRQSRIGVLGTSFNINAYENEEAEKTTLVEGSIRLLTVGHQQAALTLQPGDQSIIQQATASIQHQVNTGQALAWKNGLFNFDGASLKTVMREIGRWYNLDIVYESEPGNREIAGKMQRNLTLLQVMTILKKVNVNYRLEGRTLIITK